MGNGSQEERELKFVPDADFDLSAAGDFGVDVTVEPAGTKQQHATYFDSADYRLTRAGASLRHRDDDGWTVKLPGSADVALVRTELHVDGEAGDPPAAARDLVVALCGGHRSSLPRTLTPFANASCSAGPTAIRSPSSPTTTSPCAPRAVR